MALASLIYEWDEISKPVFFAGDEGDRSEAQAPDRLVVEAFPPARFSASTAQASSESSTWSSTAPIPSLIQSVFT